MFFFRKPPPVPEERPPHEAESLEVLNRLLDGMGTQASVEHLQRDGRLVFNLSCGQDDSMVIGRKGKTLEALQLILNRIISRRFPDEKPVLIDVGGYRERRHHNLTVLARRSAENVRETGDGVIVGPYNAYERHLVHSAVQDDPEITTESQGDGDYKQILFRLRSSGEPSPGE